MKNILITGANGQLGSELREATKDDSAYNCVFTDVAELDITNTDAVERYVSLHAIDAVINCAAYTNVDKAETDAELCRLVNTVGPKTLASVAAKRGIILVHVSTDYVFDGTAHLPYREEDPTSPLGVYGVTKLEGEQAIVKSGCRGIIIRTSWLYSTFGNNFVKTMLRLGAERSELKVIFDQVGTPTYARDLATTILGLLPQIGTRAAEVYHFSNEGVCSWYDFSTAIMKLSHTTCQVDPIESSEYPVAAQRPHYSVLNKRKIKADFGIEIPHWERSLVDCLNALKNE